MMGLDTPETCKGWRNILRISCASSWFFLNEGPTFSLIAPTVGHCSKVFPTSMLPLNTATGMKSCVPFHCLWVTAKPHQQLCHHWGLEKLWKLILICDRDDSWNGSFLRRCIKTLRLRGIEFLPLYVLGMSTEFLFFENCALLDYYAASSGNSLLTFRDNFGSIFKGQESKKHS
jgi:hypothetical protein